MGKVGSTILLNIVQAICRSLGQKILRVTGSENKNEKKSYAVDSGHNILPRVSKESTRTSLGSIKWNNLLKIICKQFI